MSDKTEVFRPEHYLVGPGKKIFIDENKTLGRSKANITIDDKKLSGLHCQFTLKGLQLLVRDLSSTNGVYLNGRKLDISEEAPLKNGDELKLGSHSYFYYDSLAQIPTGENVPKALKERNFKKLITNPMNYHTVFDANRDRKIVYICWLLLYFFPLAMEESYLIVKEISFLEHYRELPSEEHLTYLGVFFGYIGILLHGLWCYYREPGLFQKLGAAFFITLFIAFINVNVGTTHMRLKKYSLNYKWRNEDKIHNHKKLDKENMFQFHDSYCDLSRRINNEDKIKLKKAHLESFQSIKAVNPDVREYDGECPVRYKVKPADAVSVPKVVEE